MFSSRKRGRKILSIVPEFATVVSAEGTDQNSCLISPHVAVCSPERTGMQQGWMYVSVC